MQKTLSVKDAEHLMAQGLLPQAVSVLWRMHEQHQLLDKDWLDCLLLLVARIDAAGFRPLAQAWLARAAPIAEGMGLQLQPPLRLAPHLAQIAFDQVLGRSLKRYPAFESTDAYVYVIEIAGACHLRCPSCPVGSMPQEPRPQGLMALGVFEQILEKIGKDRPSTPIMVHLFNWGEPLLHPQLDLFVRAIRNRGWKSIVSTTLNISRGLDKLVAAGPDILKISMSGWDQADYSQTHARGDVARVKTNLLELKRLLDERPVDKVTQEPVHVVLGYHLYRHNRHGAEQVKQLAGELGFHYTENQAVIQPIERNLDLLSGQADPMTQEIAQKLLTHPKDISKFNQKHRSGQFDCELRFNMTAINVDTSVALCCGTFSKHLQIHDRFLEADCQALEQAKYQSDFCAECMQCGFAGTVNDVLDAHELGELS